MLADFLTKPLKGALFRKFREVILGRAHIRTLIGTAPIPAEERVGNTHPVSVDTDSSTQDIARPTVGEQTMEKEDDGFVQVPYKKKKQVGTKINERAPVVKGRDMADNASEVSKISKREKFVSNFINSKLSRLT
jgi:hypothetical protein